MSEVIDQAIAIARADLRWCYAERGIHSGSRLVYWSWDSFFASFGALALGDYSIVRTNLELYLGYQREDGAVPKRVANPWYFLRFLGLPVKEAPHLQRPTFWNAYYTAQSVTQNPTLILAFHAYVEQSGDRDFLEHYYPHLQRIIRYLKTCEDSRGLLREGFGGGWAESVLKRGAIAFTNVCYARAFYCMAELAAALGKSKEAKQYKDHQVNLTEAINEVLWSDEQGGFYSDWYGWNRHHHFAADGNLLAILWDVASEKQATKIQRRIDTMMLEKDVPLQLSDDQYVFWRIFIANRIGGLKDYHVGFSWTWLGCVDVLVRLKLGQRKEGLAILERIAQVIVQDSTVHEIYYAGKPVTTRFYESEHPWGWAAGLFLYACAQAGYSVADTSLAPAWSANQAEAIPNEQYAQG